MSTLYCVYCIVMISIILHCILHCTVPHCTVLQYILLLSQLSSFLTNSLFELELVEKKNPSRHMVYVEVASASHILINSTKLINHITFFI